MDASKTTQNYVSYIYSKEVILKSLLEKASSPMMPFPDTIKSYMTVITLTPRWASHALLSKRSQK